MMRYAIVLFLTATAAACGGGNNGSATGDLPASDADASGYPAGPYNHAIGSVIPPLTWIGYDVPQANALATTATYAAYSMDDLRRSGAPYGVVHVADFF